MDNGNLAYYTVAKPAAIHRVKRYDATKKTYANQFYILTDTGALHGQTNTTGNSYTIMTQGIGIGEMTSYYDRNFRAFGVVFGKTKCVLANDQKGTTSLSVEKPSGAGCYFKHRLFVAVKPSTVVYSAVDNFTNFTDSLDEGGKISFPAGGGEIVAIRPFKNALYVFFEQGIMRVKINGLPKEFSAEKVEYRGGKIFGRTVCVCENAILFMTADGLYRLDERGVKTVGRGMMKPPYAETGLEGAAAWRGKAYIRYQVEYDKYQTLSVNEDGSACVYLDDMEGFSQEDGGMALFRGQDNSILCFSDKEEKVFNDNAVLKTFETNFGTQTRKVLTRIWLTGRGGFGFSIWNGKKKTQKWLYLNDEPKEIRLYDRGERFSFEIETSSFTEIREMTVEMRIPV